VTAASLSDVLNRRQHSKDARDR